MYIYVVKDEFRCSECAKALGAVDRIPMTPGTYFVCDVCRKKTHADTETPKHPKPNHRR